MPVKGTRVHSSVTQRNFLLIGGRFSEAKLHPQSTVPGDLHEALLSLLESLFSGATLADSVDIYHEYVLELIPRFLFSYLFHSFACCRGSVSSYQSPWFRVHSMMSEQLCSHNHLTCKAWKLFNVQENIRRLCLF